MEKRRYRSKHFEDGSCEIYIPKHGWKHYTKEEKEELISVLKSI